MNRYVILSEPERSALLLAVFDELLPVGGECVFVELRSVGAVLAYAALGAFVESYYARLVTIAGGIFT